MCESVSALKYENKYYFLTSDKLDTFLRSKKGIEWKKTHGINDDDVKGHGFLEEFIYPELKGKAEHWECTDFSSPKNFPDEIVKQLKLGNLRFAIPDSPKQLLTDPAFAEYKKISGQAFAEYEKISGQAFAEYEKISGPAYAEYEKITDQAYAEYEKIRGQAFAEYKKIRDPAYAEYEKITDPAYAEYEKIRGQAFAEYEKIRDQAEAEYKKIRDQAEAEYEKISGPAEAEYEKIRVDTFWNLFMVKKNRAKAWK
jgi:vacuolar-type H+-ATPase subunit E/Vma4